MVILTLLSYALAFVAGGLTMRAFPKAGDVLDRATTALLGRLPKPAAKPLGFGAIERAGQNRGQNQKSPNLSEMAGNIAGFFLHYWKPILFVGFAIVVILFLRGCSGPFGLGKSSGELRLEARLAQAEAHVHEVENQRDAEIARIAQSVALLRQENSMLLQRGRDEIAAATPDNEAPIDPALVAAWRGAISSLRSHAAGDSALADSDRSSA